MYLFYPQKMKAYITDPNRNQPLVVYGDSGTGKTAVMAKAASLTKQWLKKEALVIVRYCKTYHTSDITNRSSHLNHAVPEIYIVKICYTEEFAKTILLFLELTVKCFCYACRFLGTSPDSSSLMTVLNSICTQIRRAFRLPVNKMTLVCLHVTVHI